MVFSGIRESAGFVERYETVSYLLKITVQVFDAPVNPFHSCEEKAILVVSV